MLTSISQIVMKTKEMRKVNVVVAAAHESNVMKAIWQAYKEGMVEAILVGDENKIISICMELGIDPSVFEIVNVEENLQVQAEKAVSIISEGRGHILMKGLIDTSILLKALLKKEYNLRTDRLMSIVGVFESQYYHKLFMITDPGMNLRPNLLQKKQIIENSLQLTRALGITMPKVAVMCAKEKVNDKMQETLDAAELKLMNSRGEISDCIVSGPLAFDNIISKEAALIKGISDPVAGDADIILVPDLVSGNSLYKSLVYLSDSKCAGVIMGAKVPVVVTSRADTDEMKMYSIALAVLAANNYREEEEYES